jgi:hypothetical protein
MAAMLLVEYSNVITFIKCSCIFFLEQSEGITKL